MSGKGETVTCGFTPRALIRLLGRLNNWPCRNRGEQKLIDRLAGIIELTDEEKERIGFKLTELNGTPVYFWKNDGALEREISEQDRRTLLQIAQPTQEQPWAREDRTVFDELMGALGGAMWGDDPEADGLTGPAIL
jgi:hypothetical protein